MPLSNDPNIVRQEYATDQSLRIRQHIHDAYTVPKVNYMEWVLESTIWKGTEHVLDVGCGSGTYSSVLTEKWPDATYYGVDLSPAMLDVHPKREAVSIADAMQLPFPAGSFDIVMANHMLYHVPDIDRAIVEFRRVLKPGGVLVCATNSVNNMPELQVLMRRAILLLAPTGSTHIQPPLPVSELFALENGTRRLARHFYAVVRHDLPSKLVFPEIDPLMTYLESTRTMREGQLPASVNWDDVMLIMRQQISHLVNHLGELAINQLSGALVASDDGGFIEEFVSRLD